jgi:MFS family permease
MLAIAIAGIVTAVTIRTATFVPWGTDPAAYVNAAQRWAEADLFAPDSFQLLPRWQLLGLPLAERPGAITGTYVSMYPPGLPLLMSVGHLIDADVGPYLIPPIFAGLLVFATFAIGEIAAGAAAGLLAAAMMAVNPIIWEFAITPMSDVPATALLMIALVMSVRPSLMAAAAAGGCVAFAFLSRPVVAPLTAVSFLLVLFDGVPRIRIWRSWRWTHAATFAVMASLGPLLLAATQFVLYGDPLTPGYPTFGMFFSSDRMAANFGVYTQHLATLQSPFIFLGLFAALPLYFAREHRDPLSRRMLLAAMVTVVINYAVYLPYMTYEELSFTRFLLPAQAALIVLLAAAVVYAFAVVARAWKWLAVIALVPAAIVLNESRSRVAPFLSVHSGQAHVRSMGKYLHETLPSNAAVITFIQSRAIAHYTGAQIVRFDLLSPADAEAIVEMLLRRKYRPLFIVDDQMDWSVYVQAFRGTKYQKLDWPPRATFVAASQLWLYDLADRDRRPGEVPLDVLSKNLTQQ